MATRGRPPKNNSILPASPIIQHNVTAQRSDIIADTARDIAEQKLALNAKRQEYSLKLDARKLERALKLADSADKIAEIACDETVLERVRNNLKSPMDMKFLAESMKIISQELKSVERPDTDENGNRVPKSVRLLFKNKDTSLALEVPQNVDGDY